MKKSLIIAAALLSVVLVTSNGFARGYGKGCGGVRGYGANGGPAMADLTDEQKTKLADLRQNFIDETYELRSSMMNQRLNMQMLLETSDPDRNKLAAMSDAILDLQKKIADKRIDFVLAAKKIAPTLKMRGLGGFGLGPGPKGGKHHNRGQTPCPRFGNGNFQRGTGPCAAARTIDQ
jgi:zinc resistance-associated protein